MINILSYSINYNISHVAYSKTPTPDVMLQVFSSVSFWPSFLLFFEAEPNSEYVSNVCAAQKILCATGRPISDPRLRAHAHIRMTTGEFDFEIVVVVHDKVHVRLGESASRSPHLITFGTNF